MNVTDATEFVLNGLPQAKTQPFKGNPLATFIRSDWRDSVAAIVDDDGYILKGSPGMTQWADSVWLGIYDEVVTTSAQRGFYLTFLVASDGSKVHLSLAQTISEAREEAGRGARQLLRATAERDVSLLGSERLKGLQTGPIDLQAKVGSRSRAYQDSVIASTPFERGSVPPPGEVEDTLLRFLALYADLVELRDELTADDAMPTEKEQSAEERTEAKRYRWHRRAERSQDLSKLAKEHHGWTCQVEACGKTLTVIYGDEHHKPFIEAHHLVPFADLKGRPTKLDPKTDFAVVCPDCHRMLHQRKGKPYTLEDLSDHISKAN